MYFCDYIVFFFISDSFIDSCKKKKIDVFNV